MGRKSGPPEAGKGVRKGWRVSIVKNGLCTFESFNDKIRNRRTKERKKRNEKKNKEVRAGRPRNLPAGVPGLSSQVEREC